MSTVYTKISIIEYLLEEYPVLNQRRVGRKRRTCSDVNLAEGAPEEKCVCEWVSSECRCQSGLVLQNLKYPDTTHLYFVCNII